MATQQEQEREFELYVPTHCPGLEDMISWMIAGTLPPEGAEVSYLCGNKRKEFFLNGIYSYTVGDLLGRKVIWKGTLIEKGGGHRRYTMWFTFKTRRAVICSEDHPGLLPYFLWEMGYTTEKTELFRLVGPNNDTRESNDSLFLAFRVAGGVCAYKDSIPDIGCSAESFIELLIKSESEMHWIPLLLKAAEAFENFGALLTWPARIKLIDPLARYFDSLRRGYEQEGDCPNPQIAVVTFFQVEKWPDPYCPGRKPENELSDAEMRKEFRFRWQDRLNIPPDSA